MRKFIMEKLVRDKIVNNILSSNKLNKVDFRVLNNKDFLKNLKKKFFEELKELDLNKKEDAIKELADLQLIIDTCLKNLKISQKEFKEIFKNKNKKVGKFDKKIYIKTVELAEKDEWLPYYEKNYKKYKEIK
jgi:predicted house-cleaning noncanonical NTP pyrophosphatase (MazG superfamily)